MSEAGSPTANGNGSKSPWEVRKTDSYLEDRAKLESAYPGLSRVFGIIDRQFEVLPALNSRQLFAGSETWLYRTSLGFGAPPLFIYYEIWEVERVVWLLAAHRAD